MGGLWLSAYDAAMNASTDISPDLQERARAYDTVAAALSWLQAHADEQPALAEMAAQAGLSEFHFQRVFARWAGLSPKRFLQHLSRARAREALLQGADLLLASAEAGLSGPGRLHDLMVNCEAASPGEIKSGGAGLVVQWGLADTPFGPALLAASPRGLMKLAFIADDGTVEAAELCQEWPAAELQRDDGKAAALALRIFSAYRQPEPLPLFVKGTQFQLKVWEALLRVPDGRLVTYGELARGIGQPAASRAVGSAVGANPVALLIPCHRVIRSDGLLGNYRWGELRKQVLVSAELALQG